MWPSPVEPVPVEDMDVVEKSSGRHQASTILGFISYPPQDRTTPLEALTCVYVPSSMFLTMAPVTRPSLSCRSWTPAVLKRMSMLSYVAMASLSASMTKGPSSQDVAPVLSNVCSPFTASPSSLVARILMPLVLRSSTSCMKSMAAPELLMNDQTFSWRTR